MERVILHSDMNSFYASVECMLNPELRGHPVAVCGATEDRHGIVLTKNTEAKAYGIQTGEVVWQAKQKCKDLIVVKPNYENYIKYSKLAREIYNRYTDLVEPFGMDECWLDVTGSSHSFGTGLEIAEEIRKTIKFELGLTVSIGVSFNKVFAKLGSDMKKPDAITVINKDTFKEKIWQLPASDLLGVGRATIKKLNYYGIFTIGDLANTSPDFLKNLLGVNGILLWKYANGTEKSLVTPNDFEVPIKSVSHGITTVRDLQSNNDVWPVILELIQDIGERLRKYNKYASGIAICVRDSELHFKEWQTKLPQQTNSSFYLAKKAYKLFNENYDWNCDIRSVTVRAINLVSEQTPQQIDLFSETQNIDKMERLETVIDNIRERFGKDIIRKYALTELLICGECGTPYRRCTWTTREKTKKVVWRCISRLDYGKKYCKHSPSIEESVLQNAIMDAILKMAKENADVLKTLKSHIAMGLNADSINDNSIELQIRIAEIDAEFSKLITSTNIENENDETEKH